jgi:hypothetical protein
MKKLSIVEALCIIQSGISNNDERELYDDAFDVVVKEGKRLKLIHKKELIDLELAKGMEGHQQGYSEDDLKDAFSMGRIGKTIEDFNKKFKTKDRIMSETPEEIKQRARDYGNSLVKGEPKGQSNLEEYISLVEKHTSPKEESKQELPTNLESVLAKITHQNDLGLSQWHEVVYYDNDTEKWCCYSGSKTFQDGERVVDWKYCKDLL